MGYREMTVEEFFELDDKRYDDAVVSGFLDIDQMMRKATPRNKKELQKKYNELIEILPKNKVLALGEICKNHGVWASCFKEHLMEWAKNNDCEIVSKRGKGTIILTKRCKHDEDG